MLLQCFAHGCVGICRMSYFDSVCQNYSRDVVILTVCVFFVIGYIRCSLQIQGHLTASL